MTPSRAVIGLLTGHNTLRRHLHMLGLTDSALCRKCGVEEETSDHILCKCEALAAFGHVHLGSFSLELEDIQSISLGAICNFSKDMGLPSIVLGKHRPIQKKPRCVRSCEVPKPRAMYLSTSIPNHQHLQSNAHNSGGYFVCKYCGNRVLFFVPARLFWRLSCWCSVWWGQKTFWHVPPLVRIWYMIDKQLRHDQLCSFFWGPLSNHIRINWELSLWSVMEPSTILWRCCVLVHCYDSSPLQTHIY